MLSRPPFETPPAAAPQGKLGRIEARMVAALGRVSGAASFDTGGCAALLRMTNVGGRMWESGSPRSGGGRRELILDGRNQPQALARLAIRISRTLATAAA